MWISLKIINKMVDISDIAPEEVADRLTMATAEIEGIEYFNDNFKTIYAAKLTKVEKHPDADKLTLCEADTGSEKLQVVCGAQNHKEGDIVALAAVGTKITEDFVIKKSKIRGVESNGMLCSERELGISEDHSGIIILPPDTKPGTTLESIYPDLVDIRLEIDNKSITHRPDLWGHEGFARETGALFSRPVKSPVNRDLVKTFKNNENLEVEILNPEIAPRYSALAVKGIKIKESPEWLKAMVKSTGMRPINNIVDITNYVMAELGEPMHAFDRKKLRGNKIFIRTAKEGEIITTLDDSEHKLTGEDIVIADVQGPIALAGIMGGGNSEIDDSTTEIVLEAACFNPVNIRKTAHRFGIRTEASMRFEKSLSPEITADALIRCYELIKEAIPEAEAVTEIIDDYPGKMKTLTITTSTDHIRKKLGQDIDDKRITDIIESLSFNIRKNGSSMEITVPHFRATKDVAIADDIVEEVGRIYGYDNIEPSAPLVPCVPPAKNDFRMFERTVKSILTSSFSMVEVMGYSFTGEKILNMLGINNDRELRLRNPLSIEQDRLRRSIVPDMVSFIHYNQRYSDNFSIFELGRVYLKDDRKSTELISENTRAAGAVYMKKPSGPLFFEAKRIASGLMEQLKVKKFRLIPETDSLPPYAHPGRSMRITVEGKDAGFIFELHPETAEKFEINGKAAIFDLDLNAVFESQKNETKFRELQKFPGVPFEISVLADKRCYSEDILTIIRKSSRYIQSAEVVSVYEGNPVPEGKKSVSVKIIFASPEKTLDTAEIEETQKKIIADINKAGFSLR
jgi:phenylalanyl-tRNA synthetase beta chain